ncbi:MAG: phenylalanine--tRNA ligase subunit beta, partial [Clostridiales bacterium]|nr:phenylalanine--tRNA ligase subunit beta [Clostridiales bacterium]
MLLPISWLKDFVNLKGITTDELAKKLVSVGFEIEEIIDQGTVRKGIYTAEIFYIEKHPKADKLDICGVRSKGGATYRIVTGAKNIKAGDIVPLALDGAVIPDGTGITNTEFRGVISEGMFCGGAELALTESDYTGASVNG